MTSVHEKKFLKMTRNDRVAKSRAGRSQKWMHLFRIGDCLSDNKTAIKIIGEKSFVPWNMPSPIKHSLRSSEWKKLQTQNLHRFSFLFAGIMQPTCYQSNVKLSYERSVTFVFTAFAVVSTENVSVQCIVNIRWRCWCWWKWWRVRMGGDYAFHGSVQEQIVVLQRRKILLK